MKIQWSWLVLAAMWLALPGAAEESIANFVVKIHCTSIAPDYKRPWEMQKPQRSTGSGMLIAGDRVLTNAHTVSNATNILVQKENDPVKYNAKVEYIGHDCDLALLKVEKDLVAGKPPFELGDLPDLKSVVAVYGFPTGGEQISVTEGVVSRIDVGTYNHTGGRSYLQIQIDAAVNPGNSGGPVIQNDRVVGLAFQIMPDAQNISYVIPAMIIAHFLKDVEDGLYEGFPSIEFGGQNLENPAFRELLGMTPDQSGIYISNMYSNSAGAAELREGDVLLEFDGVPVANDGTIAFGKSRVNFGVLLARKFMNDLLPVTLLRHGRTLKLSILLAPQETQVPLLNEYEVLPRYFIFGGVVFQPLNREYMELWDEWWNNADKRYLYYAFYQSLNIIPESRKELVVISQILPDEVNTYIKNMEDDIVREINGVPINCLEDVIAAFTKPDGKYHVIRTESILPPLLLGVAETEAANKRILANYQIPSDRRLDRHTGYGR